MSRRREGREEKKEGGKGREGERRGGEGREGEGRGGKGRGGREQLVNESLKTTLTHVL